MKTQLPPSGAPPKIPGPIARAKTTETPSTNGTTSTTATATAAPAAATKSNVHSDRYAPVAPGTTAAGGLPGAPVQRATVVGAGPAGLAQASLLLQRAGAIGLKELTVVELRSEYTRPVGLNFRQINFDALAWLNPKAYDAMADACGMPKRGDQGFMHSVWWNPETAAYEASKKPPGKPGSAARFEDVLADQSKSVAEVAHDMLNASTIGVVTMSDLEDAYWQGLEALAKEKGVTLHIKREHVAEPTVDKETGVVSLAVREQVKGKDGKRVAADTATPLPAQDLILVSQGSNSQMRRDLGVDSKRIMSPGERYIAGVLQDAPGKEPVARTVYRENVVEDPETGQRSVQRLIRSVHGQNGKHWSLLQVPEHLVFDAQNPQQLAAHVEAFYRHQHAQTGPSDLPLTFGPNMFTLQGQLFDTALLGENVVAVGDAVGTSHFNVSGGAATGVTIHTLALDRYLSELVAGTPKDVARAALDADLRGASLTWQLFGITQFEGDPVAVRDQYVPKSLLQSVLPKELVERYYPKAPSSENELGVDAKKNPAWAAWATRGETLKGAKDVVSMPAEVAHAILQATTAANSDVVLPEPRLQA